jgi:hypothetical protein
MQIGSNPYSPIEKRSEEHMAGELWQRIVRLNPDIDIVDFSCGEPTIDMWFQKNAVEQQEQRGCTVYVALDASDVIIGFFSLNMYYLQKRILPDPVKDGIALQQGNIPCILLGQFGVDSRFRGANREKRGCAPQGPLLIQEAISIAQNLADSVNCRAMYVQALNDDLVQWYVRQGFTSFPNKPRNLILDLKRR